MAAAATSAITYGNDRVSWAVSHKPMRLCDGPSYISDTPGDVKGFSSDPGKAQDRKTPRIGSVAGRDFGARYVSSGLRNVNVAAAKAPPKKLASRKIQMLPRLDNPMTVMPTATAGLNAPPEIAPTE